MKQEAPVKPERNGGLEPADYPDLTNGLTDAEVESTLNGLSLDDLNELNKLLDDAGDGPFDLKGIFSYAKQANRSIIHFFQSKQALGDTISKPRSKITQMWTVWTRTWKVP